MRQKTIKLIHLISLSQLNGALGSGLCATSANTHTQQLIPKRWCDMHFGARGGPAPHEGIL